MIVPFRVCVVLLARISSVEPKQELHCKVQEATKLEPSSRPLSGNLESGLPRRRGALLSTSLG